MIPRPGWDSSTSAAMPSARNFSFSSFAAGSSLPGGLVVLI
jgi:hypothetical protein